MPPKAVEPGKRERYPQQHVRAGRGTPGYNGDVEVYETPVPKSFEGDGGIENLKSKDSPKGTKAKDAPEGDK